MIEAAFVSTMLLWLFFALVFPLARWAERQADSIRYSVYPLVALFLLLDVLYNLVWGSLFFLELPQGENIRWIETFSDRIQRVRSTETGWRYILAGYFRTLILTVDKEHFA